MKLVTNRPGCESAARLGVVSTDHVVDLQRLGQKTGIDLPDACFPSWTSVGRAAAATAEMLASHIENWPVGTALPVDNVTLLGRSRGHGNIFGIGLNYVEHIAESSLALDTSANLPDTPVIFFKPPTAAIGTGDAIQRNAKLTQQLDWEVELARTSLTNLAGRACDFQMRYLINKYSHLSPA